MKVKTSRDNFLSPQIYRLPSLPKVMWLALIFIPLVVSFFIYFPLASKIKSLAQAQLNQLPCPVQYHSLEVEFLLPKIILNSPSLPGSCLGLHNKNIDLNYLNLKFRGPGFYPPGIKMLLSTQLTNTTLDLYHTLSFKRQVFKMDQAQLDMSEISSLFGVLPMKGHWSVTSLLDFHTTDGLKSFHLLIQSKDTQILAQNIHGLQLPLFNLGVLQIKASSENKNKILINEIIVGDQLSPLIAHFSGSLDLLWEDPSSSPMQLSGEVKISESLLKDFTILNLFLQKYRQKDGLYQVKIQGTLAQPKFMPL